MAHISVSVYKLIEDRCYGILRPETREKHSDYYKDSEQNNTETFIGRTFNPNIHYGHKTHSSKGNINISGSGSGSGSSSMSRSGPNLSGFVF